MKLSHLIKTGAVILPVLAAALPASASAATQVVTLQCNNFVTQRNGLQVQNLFSVQASMGVALPPTCAAVSNSCAQCVADLMTNGFTPVNSFDTTPNNGGNATPYFIFKK